MAADERSQDLPIMAVMGRSQDPPVEEEEDLPVEEEEPCEDSPKERSYADLSRGSCRMGFIGRISSHEIRQEDLSQRCRSSFIVPHQ
jgi:hypothetical protein